MYNSELTIPTTGRKTLCNRGHIENRASNALAYALENINVLHEGSLSKYSSEIVINALFDRLNRIISGKLNLANDTTLIRQFNFIKSELVKRINFLEDTSKTQQIADQIREGVNTSSPKFDKFRKKILGLRIFEIKPARRGSHINKANLKIHLEDSQDTILNRLLNIQPDKEGNTKKYQLRQIIRNIVGPMIDIIDAKQERVNQYNRINEFIVSEDPQLSELAEAIAISELIYTDLITIEHNQVLANELRSIQNTFTQLSEIGQINKNIGISPNEQITKNCSVSTSTTATSSGLAGLAETITPRQLEQACEPGFANQQIIEYNLTKLDNLDLSIEDLTNFIDNYPSDLGDELANKLADIISYLLISKFDIKLENFLPPLQKLYLKYPHLAFFVIEFIEEYEENSLIKVQLNLEILEFALKNDLLLAMIKLPEYLVEARKLLSDQNRIDKLWESYSKILIKKVTCNEDRNAQAMYGTAIYDKNPYKQLPKKVGLEFLLKCHAYSPTTPLHHLLEILSFFKLGLYFKHQFEDIENEFDSRESKILKHNLAKKLNIKNQEQLRREFSNLREVPTIEFVDTISSIHKKEYFNRKFMYAMPSAIKHSLIPINKIWSDTEIKLFNRLHNQETAFKQFSMDIDMNKDKLNKYLNQTLEVSQSDMRYEYALRSLFFNWKALASIAMLKPGYFLTDHNGNSLQQSISISLATSFVAFNCFQEAIDCYRFALSVCSYEEISDLAILLYSKAKLAKDYESLKESISYFKYLKQNSFNHRLLYDGIIDQLKNPANKKQYGWLSKMEINQLLKLEYNPKMFTSENT